MATDKTKLHLHFDAMQWRCSKLCGKGCVVDIRDLPIGSNHLSKAKGFSPSLPPHGHTTPGFGACSQASTIRNWQFVRAHFGYINYQEEGCIVHFGQPRDFTRAKPKGDLKARGKSWCRRGYTSRPVYGHSHVINPLGCIRKLQRISGPETGVQNASQQMEQYLLNP